MLTNERGGTIAFVAVSMVALLSMMALAIDLAMLYKARNEAQRAAEAASLAGASAFQDVPAGAVQLDSARVRALRLAAGNFVNNVPVDTTGATPPVTANRITTVTRAEVTLVIIPDTAKVRAYVRRQGIGMWFARMFGQNSMGVQAKAAAWASPATQVSKCAKPFAVPDFWYNPADPNRDQIWDPSETWTFDPSRGSVYNPYDPNAPANNYAWGGAGVSSTQQTGLGSNFRNGWGSAGNQARADYGRQFMIKAQDPSKSLTAPFFYLWRLPGSSGGNDIRNEISGNMCVGASIGTPYSIEPGNTLGPVKQGVNDLISQDPNARWVPPQYDGSGNLQKGTGVVTGSSSPNWVDSPRVILVAFFNPNQITGGTGPGNQKITFNNFAYLFLEPFQDNSAQAPVVARFLYYAQGTAGGTGGGPLARVLQLVE